MKPEIVEESSTLLAVKQETYSPEVASDANDYSRFDDLGDSDDDDVKTSQVVEKEDEKLSMSDSLSRANGYKDAGNSAFKRVDFVEAGRRYQEGIAILNNFIKNAAGNECDEVKSTLISLHGNNSMVLMKLENWNAAIISTCEVLKAEKKNIKALFRRGVSYHKVGFLEESKADLTYLLELDAKNAAAIKELIQVVKDIKSSKLRERVAFSSMFKKNIYGDKEAERIAKEKREEIERERENDEWIKNKLSRRESGMEQLTFEDWKKEKKESEEKELKEQKAKKEKIEKEKDDKLEYDRREKHHLEKEREIHPVNSSEDDDYDEEDSKILSETKKKGYCYFRNEQCTLFTLPFMITTCLYLSTVLTLLVLVTISAKAQQFSILIQQETPSNSHANDNY